VALIPENRRKFLEMLCEMREQKEFKLLTLSRISHELHMSHVTVSSMVEEFRALGFVKVYVVGRAKVVVPTEKLRELCDTLKEHQ